MAFSRYGLTPCRTVRSALQYVVDDQGGWMMNCFACHGGKVDGSVIPGLPNSRFALQTLTEGVRAKFNLRQVAPVDGSRQPVRSLRQHQRHDKRSDVRRGLDELRDADLSVDQDRLPPPIVHHDMDAPPWWHVQKKEFLYADGFARKGHRALMQFMMVPENGPARFHEWEADYQDVFAYISLIECLRFRMLLMRALADKGRTAFNRVCSYCHGTYGRNKDETDTWPAKVIPLSELKTDPVRLQALSPAQRNAYGSSWFTDFGKIPNVNDPKGYVAQPLDGIWASAPYLHNGSVPTLWHMLHPSERPKIWKRTETGYDQKRVGLEVETFDALPASLSAAQTREHFHTERFGK